MSIDLYQMLAVPRDAPKDVIHRAYREHAKRLHPDVGGDPGQFDLLKKAHACLMDPDTRKHYDETGEWQVKDADNKHQPALHLVMTIIDELATEYHKEQKDLMAQDAIALALHRLRSRIDERMKEIDFWVVQANVVEAFAQGFKVKDQADPNLLTPMFMARGQAVRDKVKDFEHQLDQMHEAVAILKKHIFRPNGHPKTKH